MHLIKECKAYHNLFLDNYYWYDSNTKFIFNCLLSNSKKVNLAGIKKVLSDAGLNIKGKFFEMHSRKEADTCEFSFPCVIKPSDGSGSKGVSVVELPDQLEKALDYAFESARYSEVYTESFIDGEEYSVEVFVSGNDVYVYAIVKTTFTRNVDNNADISY